MSIPGSSNADKMDQCGGGTVQHQCHQALSVSDPQDLLPSIQNRKGLDAHAYAPKFVCIMLMMLPIILQQIHFAQKG